MGFLELDKHVITLLAAGLFREPESELQKARVQASEQSDQADMQSAIKNIASTLWPVCRDPKFAARLKALAEGKSVVQESK